MGCINDIYIIIPVHNRITYTQSCLISLRNQTIRGFRVLVVDDGSTDGTAKVLSEEFPEVKVLSGDGNLWWTAATNLGVEYAMNQGANYILALNNDTVAKPDFLEKMCFWAELKPEALLGALAVDAISGEPIYGGEKINWLTAQYTPLLDEITPENRYGLHEVTHFPGRGLLIPTSVFQKIGVFDEKHLPQYAADFDFTHRAIKAGYPVYCNYDARLITYPEESEGLKLRKQKTLQNYFAHLFGMKGIANLKVFTWYAIKNCPLKYLPAFLISGFARRIFGYWLHQ